MEEKWTSLNGHLEDLRKTILHSLIIIGMGFFILFLFIQPIIKFLSILPTNLIILGPLEGIDFIIKLCFWMSIGITAPFWGCVWLKFALPGIKQNERIAIIPFLLISILSLILSIIFALKITIPISNEYLSYFNSSLGLNAWSLSHYFDYFFFMIAGHIIVFELCLLLLIFVHFRLIEYSMMENKRRIIIVFIFILSAVLTPPDIFTQILFAIPLIILYELAILYSKWRFRIFRKNYR